VNNSQVKPAKVNVRKLAKLNPQKKILRWLLKLSMIRWMDKNMAKWIHKNLSIRIEVKLYGWWIQWHCLFHDCSDRCTKTILNSLAPWFDESSRRLPLLAQLGKPDVYAVRMLPWMPLPPRPDQELAAPVSLRKVPVACAFCCCSHCAWVTISRVPLCKHPLLGVHAAHVLVCPLMRHHWLRCWQPRCALPHRFLLFAAYYYLCHQVTWNVG
jgi:hypothetical protein